MPKPPSRLPPMTAVRAFEAAARHQSFTRAAEELGMTQAAVSYQIKVLEDRIGAPLFVRLPRQVALTPLGQRLAPAVSEAFEMLRVAFAGTGRVVDNVISISVIPAIAAQWLVPRLGRFQLAHPGYAVQLDASNGMVDFAQGDFDLAIRNGLGSWPGLEAVELLPSHFTAMCSPGLIEGVALSGPADILKLPILSPRDSWWPQWFAEAGVGAVDLSDRPDHSYNTQAFEGPAAAAGQGVALLNPFFFAADLAAGRLVQIFDLVVKADRSYWIVYPKARRRSAKIQAFAAWLLAEAAGDAAKAAAHEEGRRADRPSGPAAG
jgi:LysR family transcriptional regulator, glycine cleavage system transcriptional activator